MKIYLGQCLKKFDMTIKKKEEKNISQHKVINESEVGFLFDYGKFISIKVIPEIFKKLKIKVKTNGK